LNRLTSKLTNLHAHAHVDHFMMKDSKGTVIFENGHYVDQYDTEGTKKARVEMKDREVHDFEFKGYAL